MVNAQKILHYGISQQSNAIFANEQWKMNIFFCRVVALSIEFLGECRHHNCRGTNFMAAKKQSKIVSVLYAIDKILRQGVNVKNYILVFYTLAGQVTLLSRERFQNRKATKNRSYWLHKKPCE